MKTEMTTQSIAKKISTRIIPLTLIGVGFSVLGLAAVFLTSPTKQATPTVKQSPDQIHRQFVQATAVYLGGSPAMRLSKIENLRSLAQARHAVMKNLIATDADKFVELATQVNFRDQLPDDLKNFIERPTTWSGRLRLEHADNFKNQTSSSRYYVESVAAEGDTDQREIHFISEPSDETLNQEIAGSGWELDGQLVVADDYESLAEGPLSVTSTVGQKRVAVILFNFSNNQSEPFTAEQIRQTVFDSELSVRAYFQAASFGQLELTGKNNLGGLVGAGDVYDWVTLNQTEGCSPSMMSSAQTLVGESNLTGYDYFIYFTPQVQSCGFAGLANVGSNWAWMNGTTYLGNIGHEVGHILGSGHAMACTNRNTPCSFGEYADPYDIMALGNIHQVSGSRKMLFGWLLPEEVLTVTASGSYQLFPIEVPTVNPLQPKPKLIMIQTGFVTYFLDFRNNTPPFDVFPFPSTSQGVLIRTAEGYKTLLRQTRVSQNGDVYPLLVGGQPFTDVANGVSITTQSLAPDQSSVTVQVTLSCVRRNPTVVVTGPTGFVLPGARQSYSVEVQNSDSPICGSSTFSLTPTLPAGWTQNPANPAFTVPPLTSHSVSFSITSPPTALDGYHNIPQRVTHQATGVVVTQIAQYKIDTSPPTVTFSEPTKSILPRTGPVVISGSATDPSSVLLTAIQIDGQPVQQCPTIILPAACAYSWEYSAVTPGLHTLDFLATDGAGKMSVESKTVCYPYTADGRDNACSGGGGIDPIETQ